MARKFHGVIEAVRYGPDGQVQMVRFYERRGASFSDHMLMTRVELISRLKAGKVYLTGRRVERMASTFELSGEVNLAGQAGSEWLVSRQATDARQDNLSGVPLF